MLAQLFTMRVAIPLATASAVAVLGAAYIFQHGFGYQPCQLCLYQRLPWWIAIALGCGAFMARNNLPGLSRMLLILLGLTVLTGAGVAGYHAGVEWKWWPGPSGCSGEISYNTIEELKAALLATPPVRCDETPWSLFGRSMAGYNFLLSLAVGVYAAVVPFRDR